MAIQVKKFGKFYFLLALLMTVYIAELMLIPPDQASLTRYSISATAAKVLGISFALPLFLIWYAAFYGFIKVKQYAELAGDQKDGKALHIVANGLMVLALSLPITSIIGSPRTYVISRNPEWENVITIAYNYIALALSLLALWLVAHGAKKLVRTLKKKPHSFYQVILTFIFTAFCFVYSYFTLTDEARHLYHLPDFLVFSTIIVPYICLWYLGFRAAYHIQLYRTKAPGTLYRQALKYLSSGIAMVVVSLMVLRVLTSLSSFLSSLSLRYLLVLIYLLIILIGIGYGLIAMGAKKLKKIEEV